MSAQQPSASRPAVGETHTDSVDGNVIVGKASSREATEVLAERWSTEGGGDEACTAIAEDKRLAGLDYVSWSPPSAFTFEQWVNYGRRLGSIGRAVGWWIGDWLRFGNSAYGEKYVRAARITGYDVQTLMNMSYVASRIEPSRRRENLSWSHHAEVASLPAEEQEAWLNRAEEQRFSVHDLRLEVRQHRNRGSSDALAEASEPDGSTSTLVTTCPKCGHRFEEARRHGGARAAGATSQPEAQIA
ncbi:MAG TPA: LmbU family transcriptional regulator [Solirubrobacteraceae bacterium]|jgi:hypothetical protein|nr:LmbU family transcriptional regulator [Solirubrobacteraceae bacterium]